MCMTKGHLPPMNKFACKLHGYIVYLHITLLSKLIVEVSSRFHIQICRMFFLIFSYSFHSGVLVAYGTLKLLKKRKGRLNWGLFYLHRYLR